MQSKNQADTNQKRIELIPDGIFDLCDEFPVNDKDVSFEEYFEIKHYILSPNQNYIAIFVVRTEIVVGSHSREEYILFIKSLINNKLMYFGEYIEDKLKIKDYFFSDDSRYLIFRKPTKLLYIDFLGQQKTKKKQISSQHFLSYDSSGNINLLIDSTTILTIQLETDFEQITQFQYEILFYQKLFSSFAIVESNDQTYIIHTQNQKIHLRWQHNMPSKRYFWKSFIAYGHCSDAKLRNLQTGKLIRNINPKFGFRQFSQDQTSIYLFQIVKRHQKIKKKGKNVPNTFSRFDILRGVYKKLNINIDPFNDLQTLTNYYYIDYEDLEDVDDDEEKVKKLRYFRISYLTQ
ncbi:unnamed protein product [Paramecium octaurelia]|uniref:Uncharacterized protein n=1 Tax=Paramecium octaurelia TaxID=43137 RepID=A0A8S1U375_PAROT|nr:unnamed protein product [Paramecium octaurelia]